MTERLDPESPGGAIEAPPGVVIEALRVESGPYGGLRCYLRDKATRSRFSVVISDRVACLDASVIEATFKLRIAEHLAEEEMESAGACPREDRTMSGERW